MRCLFCGKRLALLRKLTDGEFCSTAHRKRYLEEEQKLALARLIEEQHRTDRRPQSLSACTEKIPARDWRWCGTTELVDHIAWRRMRST